MLSKQQIEKIYELVDFHVNNIAWKTFGVDVLDRAQKELLKKFGLDIDKLARHIPTYLQSWMFGRLTAKLSEYQSKQITYSNFIKYLDKKQFSPPSQSEVLRYELARMRSYSHLKGLSDTIKNNIVETINNEVLESAMTKEGVVAEEIRKGVLDRKSVTQIAKNIGGRLGVWNRDWDRIVQTEYQAIFNLGRLQTFMKEGNGLEQKIYFDVYGGACKHCIRLYLTGGLGSEPIIFTAKELIENGTNIGLKPSDWKATILSGIHPFCRCNARRFREGLEWDKPSRSYKAPENYQRKTAPHVKVKVTVGEQEFLV